MAESRRSHFERIIDKISVKDTNTNKATGKNDGSNSHTVKNNSLLRILASPFTMSCHSVFTLPREERTVSAESFFRKVSCRREERQDCHENRNTAELGLCNAVFREQNEGDDADRGAAVPRDSSVLNSASKPDLVELILIHCGEDSRYCSILERILNDGFLLDNTLELVRISHRGILDTHYSLFLQKIFEKSAKSLEVLELDNFEIHEDGSTALLFESLECCQNLRTLHISDWRKMQPKHFSFLSQAIRSLSNLETLYLHGDNMDAAGLSTLLRGIAGHPELTYLTLDENPIGDEGAIELSKFLASDRCKKIEYLSLWGCEIWDDGWDAVASGLARFHTLKTLFAGGDLDQHLDKVLESVKVNMTLTELSHDDDDPSSPQISHFLRLNWANRKALMNEPIASRAWREAFERLNVLEEPNIDSEMLFYLLRHRPEMMDVLKR